MRALLRSVETRHRSFCLPTSVYKARPFSSSSFFFPFSTNQKKAERVVLTNNLSTLFVMKIGESLLRDELYFRRELPRGTLQVYRALVGCIFPTTNDASREKEFNINEVLEHNLANFYSEALKKMEESGYSCYHVLNKLSDLRLLRAEILIGAKREQGEQVQGLELVSRFSMLPIFIPNLDQSQTGGDGELVGRLSLMALSAMTKMRKFVTLRVWLDLTANEVFAIKDSSGSVVQGSIEAKDNVHELLLEVTLINSMPFESWYRSLVLNTWAIHEVSLVDFDAHLQGNRFLRYQQHQ